jgi:hypothetical protein
MTRSVNPFHLPLAAVVNQALATAIESFEDGVSESFAGDALGVSDLVDKRTWAAHAFFRTASWKVCVMGPPGACTYACNCPVFLRQGECKHVTGLRLCDGDLTHTHASPGDCRELTGSRQGFKNKKGAGRPSARGLSMGESLPFVVASEAPPLANPPRTPVPAPVFLLSHCVTAPCLHCVYAHFMPILSLATPRLSATHLIKCAVVTREAGQAFVQPPQ